MITITRAPPYITVQNGGRKHSRSFGVPRGGAMDLFAIRAVNAIVGNSLDAAALEWALGGGAVRFDRDCFFCDRRRDRARDALGKGSSLHARPPSLGPATSSRSNKSSAAAFSIWPATGGSTCPFSSAADPPISRDTSEDTKDGCSEAEIRSRLGARPSTHPAEGFHSAADLMPRYDSAIVHVTPGTQEDLFDESAMRTLTESEYRISTASDRTGYKLEGPPSANSLGVPPPRLAARAQSRYRATDCRSR